MPIMQTVIQGGGSAPVIDTLNVTPTTSAQTITAPSGTDGYSPVNVSAVTSAIDANIQAGNIKNGVTILGTTGTYTGGAVAEPKIVMYNITDNNKTVLNRGNQVDLNGAEDIGDIALQYACQKGGSPTQNQYALIGTQNLTTISGNQALFHAFENALKITSTGLSGITSITGYQALQYAFKGSAVQTADLGSLETAEVKTSTGTTAYSPFDYTFQDCGNLTSVDLKSFKYFVYNGSGATTFYGFRYTFSGCSALVSVDLSSFESFIGGDFQYAFQNCSSLTTITYDQTKIASAFSGSTVSVVKKYSFNYAFNNCTALQTPYFIKELTGKCSFEDSACTSMFNGCTSLTSTGLSNITNIGGTASCFGSMYKGCTSLTSTGLSNVHKISVSGTSSNASMYQMFEGCTGLTSTGLSKVVFAGQNGTYTFGYMYKGCTGLTNETFTNLAEVDKNNAFYCMFIGCTGLQSLSFPNLIASKLYGNTTFTSMLSGCSGVTVHFPSNAQSVIGSWSSVTGGFGGTNTTVLFDLPAAYYITMSDYEYSPIYRMPTEDTATSLAWYYRGDDEMLYTSGTSQPSVGDTIYTDSACTVSSGHTVSQII